MTRSRFEDILKCIHLIDNKSIISNKNDPTYDKIAKTRWLVEARNELCRQFYNAKQNLCVDEMMIKYIGNYSPIR
jgi:hypothetical protein